MKFTVIGTAVLLALANSTNASTTPPIEKQFNNILTKIFGEKSEEQIKIKAIEDRIKLIREDSEFLDIFKSDLLPNIQIIEEYTKAFIKKKPELINVIFEAIIESAKNEEIKTALKENFKETLNSITADVADGVLSIEQLFKKYESSPVLMTMIYSIEKDKAEVDQDTNKQLLAGFEKSQKKGFPIYALGLLGLAGAGGGGGGGGGGGTTTCGGGPCTPIFNQSSFETAEYNNQYGLGMIKASSVYQYGGFGDGITIAVFDTGIRATHQAFAGRIADGGYDYVTNSANVTSDGVSGHGSHVSGIISGNKNDIQMHGVAFNSKIMPFKILGTLNAAWSLDTSVAHAVTRSLNNGVFVNNHSWGLTDGVNEILINNANRNNILLNFVNSNTSFTQSVTSGAVHVWAAGNDSQTEVGILAGIPVLNAGAEIGWVAVVAVGADGVIAGYSNRCGVAAAWCLAAPGTDVNSVSITNDSSYVAQSGTSMAAPHVSGAIAALKTRFPNLTFQQVRNRILVTANRTGIYATTTIYGQGLMDLDAAASPVGVLSIPTSRSTTGVSQSLGSSALVLPQGVVLTGLPAEVLALDSFQDAPFYIKSATLVQNKKRQFRFDFSNITDESIAVNQNGLDVRTGKNLNELKVALADGEASLSLGLLNNSFVNNKLLPSSMLNSNRNSVLIGYGTKNRYSTLKTYTWSEHSQSQDIQSKANLKQVSFLPTFTSGVAISFDSRLNNRVSVLAGMGVAAANGGFGGFNGSGAFNLKPKSAVSNWLGLNLTSEIGEMRADTLLRFTQWNVKQDMSNSLLRSSENLKINDFELSSSFRSDNSKTSATVSLGLAKTGDSGSYDVALPTSIDENGVIGYSNASIAKSSLFNEARGQFKLSRALSSNNTISTFYGFRKDQQIQHLLGVGLSIKF